MKIIKLMGIAMLSLGLSGCMAAHGLLGMGGGCGMMGGHGGHGGSSDQRESHQSPPAAVKATCPVCSATFSVVESAPRTIHSGKSYYFDSEDHLKAFVNDPDTYLRRKEEKPEGGEHRH